MKIVGDARECVAQCSTRLETCPKCGVVGRLYRPIAKMVENWRKEIFAFFDYPVTNAYTEAVNGLVKIANRAGRGYSFDTIRAKAIQMEMGGRLHKCPSCLGHYPESSFKPLLMDPNNKIDWVEFCTNCHYRFHTGEKLYATKGFTLFSPRVSG